MLEKTCDPVKRFAIGGKGAELNIKLEGDEESWTEFWKQKKQAAKMLNHLQSCYKGGRSLAVRLAVAFKKNAEPATFDGKPKTFDELRAMLLAQLQTLQDFIASLEMQLEELKEYTVSTSSEDIFLIAMCLIEFQKIDVEVFKPPATSQELRKGTELLKEINELAASHKSGANDAANRYNDALRNRYNDALRPSVSSGTDAD